MESDHALASPLRSRLLTWSGLLVVWTVAWSTPAGQIGEDTKNDLYVDAWALMGRALHLWDPQVTWGSLQNQGYGYLFPMGPFYALLSEVLPVWIVQRLWWSALLTVGFLGTLALLRALGYGRWGAVHVAALAYALAPRVLSTLGAISPEAQTQLLAPLILLPLVLAGQGRLGTRRAAALSGVAILACGGVNATATLLAAIPAGCWLVTRAAWWRSALTWSWALAAAAATAWWLGPLILLGRYSPPFLNWIENARAVVKPIGLLDALKGTSHWLGHLLVPGGPWWPAGWAVADTPSVVLAGSILAGISLAGLVVPVRERRFLLLTLFLGLALLVLPQSGPLASPIAGTLREALDGPLAPLRNIHKADPLVRLPLAVGLVNALRYAAAALAAARGRFRHPRAIPLLGAGLVIVSAAPAVSGIVTTRGTFTDMPVQWREAGAWLAAHRADGGAIILPAASFGEYTWGRTIDEPLRSLTSVPYAVRDAIPLTPAGTIRFLDEVQRQAQSGRELRGVGPALLAAGVKYVVLRNDLDTKLTGGDPVVVTRSALLDTPGITRVAGFGRAGQAVTGERIAPVEIFAIDGVAAPRASLWPSTSIPSVSGASEALPSLHQYQVANGPVIFDGDAPPGLRAPRIETDSFRARTRYYGASRSHDITRTLTATEAPASTDYFPWPDPALRSVVSYGGGVRAVSASTALSDQLTLAGLHPARRPYAAIDGDPATAWLAFGDPDPTLTITFDRSHRLDRIRILPAAERTAFGGTIAAPTRVSIEAGGTHTEAVVAASGSWVTLPPVSADSLRIRIRDTAAGTPASRLTGLAEIELPDITPVEVIALPVPTTPGPTESVLITRDPDAFDGCLRTTVGYQCLTGGYRPAEESGPLLRTVHSTVAGAYALSGSLMADPAHPSPLLRRPGVRSVVASSERTLGLSGAPDVVLDGDPDTAWSPAVDDRAPSLTITFSQPQRSTGVRISARFDWLAENPSLTIAITRDGHREIARLTPGGVVALSPRTSRTLGIEFLPDAGSSALRSAEFTAIEPIGTVLPAAGDTFGAACGDGPELRVAGRRIETSVLGQRPAALGTGSAFWQACENVEIPAGTTSISIGTWQALVPTGLVARSGDSPVAGSVAAAGVPLDVSEHAGGRLVGALEPAAYERLLALTQNANPGWRATVGEQELALQTVDGYRQAFRVPAGVAGPIVVEFGPDRAYRTALAAGGVAALGLLLLALWPGAGSRRGVPIRELNGTARPGRLAIPVPHGMAGVMRWIAIPLTGLLVAGLAGLGTGFAVAVFARNRPARHLAIIVAALVSVAGVVHALAASGTGPGSAPVASSTRLLCLAAILGVLAAASARPGVRRDGASVPPTA